MKGIFIEGGIENANKRVYPLNEIKRAVETMNETIQLHGGILGEIDHPSDLKINLDRVSHTITEMWMDGNKGCGKLKILPTPMGNLAKNLLESGVKLGVSSRGSGNVSESNGQVSDFEIVTIDIVAQPSAPSAFPVPVYEGLMNMRHGHRILELAGEVNSNKNAQKYIEQSIIRMIKELKL